MDPEQLTAVGYVDNFFAQYVSWRGVTLHANGDQTLFSYTWYGDANLDGVVDSVDYGLLIGTIVSQNAGMGCASYWNGINPEWLDGDFNADGTVDTDDYGLLIGTITSGHQYNLGFDAQ